MSSFQDLEGLLWIKKNPAIYSNPPNHASDADYNPKLLYVVLSGFKGAALDKKEILLIILILLIMLPTLIKTPSYYMSSFQDLKGLLWIKKKSC